MWRSNSTKRDMCCLPVVMRMYTGGKCFHVLYRVLLMLHDLIFSLCFKNMLNSLYCFYLHYIDSIALCIDGHKRFSKNKRQLLGKEAIKQRHLRLLGYEVVQVRHSPSLLCLFPFVFFGIFSAKYMKEDNVISQHIMSVLHMYSSSIILFLLFFSRSLSMK